MWEISLILHKTQETALQIPSLYRPLIPCCIQGHQVLSKEDASKRKLLSQFIYFRHTHTHTKEKIPVRILPVISSGNTLQSEERTCHTDSTSYICPGHCLHHRTVPQVQIMPIPSKVKQRPTVIKWKNYAKESSLPPYPEILSPKSKMSKLLTKIFLTSPF